MIKSIIITKTIRSGIIGRIDINELYFPFELFFEWMESEEIISFYDEIIRYISVFIFSERFEVMFSVCIDSFESCEYFWIEESIDLVTPESFIIEYLISFWVFFILSSCKNTILVCPYKWHFFSLIESFSVDIESDFVLVARIAIREEFFIHHETHESMLIKYETSLDLLEKSRPCEIIFEEESYDCGIELICELLSFIFKEIPILWYETRIRFEHL